MSKSKICPYRRHCHSAGDCEPCDFGKAFENLSKKIRRLKEKNRQLTEENEELREDIERRCQDNLWLQHKKYVPELIASESRQDLVQRIKKRANIYVDAQTDRVRTMISIPLGVLEAILKEMDMEKLK